MLIGHILWKAIGINHQLIHINLLINTTDHHTFIDRLIITSDKISVKIYVQIIQCLNIWQRYIDKQIIHIKCMLWKLKSAFS